MKARSRAAEPKPWSAFDLAEGFHLAHALAALERAGVLDSLSRPATAGRLAGKHGLDRELLEAALQMLAARTNLIARHADKYRLTQMWDDHARFVVHQYLGAYGGNAVDLGRILRDPSAAETLIDRRQHAKAYAAAATLNAEILRDLILQLDLDHVLDLGCGTGTLLLDLARQRRRFAGWGVDANRWMCVAARQRIARAGMGRRIRIFHGDCRDLRAVIPATVAERVRTLTAASLANEFFAGDGTDAEEWLAGLKLLFPGRVMLISDYYRRLGKWRGTGPRQLLLHDFVQAISGQGVPPADLNGWRRIYRTAKCDLVNVIEDKAGSFFVHMLRL